MDQAELEAFISGFCAELNTPLELPFARSFRTGLKMYNDWNDVAALAELEDGFVAFYWSTTA